MAVCSAKWKGLTVGSAGEIVAADFLDATDSIIAILDALGSGLAMVKSDMTGNAGHIRKHVAAAPPGVTLQALVQKDIQTGVAGKDGTAAMSLLWLKRALHFLEQLISQLLQTATMEVADAGRAAYAVTLTHHHNFAVRQIFKVAITAAPYRAAFMEKVAGSEAVAAPALAEIMPNISTAVAAVNQFLVQSGLEKA